LQNEQRSTSFSPFFFTMCVLRRGASGGPRSVGRVGGSSAAPTSCVTGV
jgi:hypothetical protein